MSSSISLNALTYIAPVVLLFGVVIGLHYYKTLSRTSLILLYFLIASLMIDICARIIGQIAYTNLILFNVLSMVEILTFSMLYLPLIRSKQLVWILGSVGIAYAVVEIVRIDPSNIASFQSYSKMVASFVIVIMALTYILGQIKEECEIAKRFLNYSTIFYFSLELILLLPLNFLINYESPIVYYIWFLHLSINLLFYIFLIRYIWTNGKTQKQLYSGL